MSGDIVMDRGEFDTTWDVVIEDNDLVLTSSRLQLAAQLAQIRLLTFAGESPYDRSRGVPYLTLVFGKAPMEHSVLYLLDVLRSSPFVDEVVSPEFDLDPTTRQLTASARIVVGEDETTVGVVIS